MTRPMAKRWTVARFRADVLCVAGALLLSPVFAQPLHAQSGAVNSDRNRELNSSTAATTPWGVAEWNDSRAALNREIDRSVDADVRNIIEDPAATPLPTATPDNKQAEPFTAAARNGSRLSPFTSWSAQSTPTPREVPRTANREDSTEPRGPTLEHVPDTAAPDAHSPPQETYLQAMSKMHAEQLKLRLARDRERRFAAQCQAQHLSPPECRLQKYSEQTTDHLANPQRTDALGK